MKTLYSKTIVFQNHLLTALGERARNWRSDKAFGGELVISMREDPPKEGLRILLQATDDTDTVEIMYSPGDAPGDDSVDLAASSNGLTMSFGLGTTINYHTVAHVVTAAALTMLLGPDVTPTIGLDPERAETP